MPCGARGVAHGGQLRAAGFSVTSEGVEGFSLSRVKRTSQLRREMTMAMTDILLMTADQAATLKRLAKKAYEPDAFKRNLTRAEADKRIAALTAKLKLLDGPPHTL